MSATAAVPSSPPVKLGDRVLVDVQIMGVHTDVEVIVIQIDDEGPRGTRIIGAPEGSLATAFARYEWKPVPQEMNT